MLPAKDDWSLSLGRWMGVPLRLHVSLLLALVAIFAVTWHQREVTPFLPTSLVAAGVLLGTVLLHELGHLWACFSLGGSVYATTFTVWGSSGDYNLPERRSERVVVYLAGPFVNLVVGLLAWLLLPTSFTASEHQLVPLRLPQFDLAQWLESLLLLVAWFNFHLAAWNVLPVAPLDGGAALRELLHLAAPEAGHLKVENTVMAVGHLIAISAMIMALLVETSAASSIEPQWAFWLTLGITLMFSARREFREQVRRGAAELEDWEYGDMLEDTGEGHEVRSDWSWQPGDDFSQWLDEKHLGANKSQQAQSIPGPAGSTTLSREQLEQSEAASLDSILEKVHISGIEVLTEHERRFLERYSQKLRQKRQKD